MRAKSSRPRTKIVVAMRAFTRFLLSIKKKCEHASTIKKSEHASTAYRRGLVQVVDVVGGAGHRIIAGVPALRQVVQACRQHRIRPACKDTTPLGTIRSAAANRCLPV